MRARSRHLCILLFALLLTTMMAGSATAQRSMHRLVAGDSAFLLDGKPFQIISGEMHYSRIPREYWHDRLRKARAMGLNTISTYVFWNYHERTRGHYDFSGQRDIAAYVRAAQEEGLHVILRPGPYVCAEWDLGGYPAWLLADTAIVLRSTDPKFTRPAERWLDRLGKELAPLLSTHGGPIIAVQVENEYGSFDDDKNYLRWQLAALRHAGFGDALLYTADGDVQLPRGTLPDLPAVVNFGPGEADTAFARLHAFRPHEPLMSGEYWAGWFDQWGRPHHHTDTEQQTRELNWMLSRGYSVNMYMFHGGTSFGFMNGANGSPRAHDYWPQTTSYDYDAALDESGRPTPKYYAFRDVLARHRAGDPPPRVPDTPRPIEISAFALDDVAPLESVLGAGVKTERPKSMEELGQSYGYILYRTRVAGGSGSVQELRIDEVRDYARVYVDDSLAGTLDRRLGQNHLSVRVPRSGATLDILVANMGRINFTKALRGERKGITHAVTLDGRELTGWTVFTLPMASLDGVDFHRAASSASRGPAFYRGTFTVDHPGDTFLDMRGWGKGTVWVNGHNLGRFWRIGPQQTLYVPGPWLERGTNEVIVFDVDVPERPTLAGLSHPILDDLQQ
ncbi:MAG TPA: glycoside hydrolase family 35 protein [Gemmatimonadaceae bacterium]|nr:glycoside hydrolase family 35 protein [Gemmatimonadaceae bacterium]